MTSFLWVLLGLLLFESLGRIWWLAKGEFHARTLGNVAADLVFGLCLMGWIGYLLATGA